MKMQVGDGLSGGRAVELHEPDPVGAECLAHATGDMLNAPDQRCQVGRIQIEKILGGRPG